MSKQRIIYLDVIKVLAILLVIFNHSHFYITNASVIYNIVHVILFDFCKIAVPLFIMVSGALLLGKEVSYKDTFCKRVWRVLVPLVIVSAIYSWMYGENIGDFVLALFTNFNGDYNPYWLWYLYMLMGLYIITPFLQKMIKNFKEKDFKWFILLFVIIVSIFNILPLVSLVLFGESRHINSDFAGLLFPVAIGYYVTGYYLSKKVITKKMNIISLIVLLVSVLLGSIFIYYCLFYKNLTYDEVINYAFITVAIPALCVFIILKYYLNKELKSKKLTNLLVNSSLSVFGVYLFHVFLLDKVYRLGVVQVIFGFNQVIGVIVLDALVFVALTVLIYILRKVPIVKKFL